MPIARRALAALCLSLVAAMTASAGDVTEPPAYDKFLVIPLRFHILTSKDLPMADCTLTDADATRAVAEINRIWEKAGIRFGLDAIVREPAAQVGRFQEIVRVTNGQFADADPFAILLPMGTRAFDGLNVTLFRELPMNGTYIAAADAPIVQQDPQLRPVAGGSEVPVGRVAARGLGQALGLESRQADEVGLLSPGTNGVALGEDEVARARSFARAIPGTLDIPAANKAAEVAVARGDHAAARRIYTWLSEIPGPGAAAARKKLAALPSSGPKP